jgi:hypothetical protein
MRILSIVLCLSLAATPALTQKQNPFDVEAREYLGTPKSEASVVKGLEYLASKQAANGHWDSGNYRDDAAISGLCTLAFLSAGHQPGRGKYGEVLNKAVDYLSESTRSDGLIGRGNSAGPPMYGHGFAALCFAELYGMTKRADFKAKLENAIQMTIKAQGSEGGWRYQPNSPDADISVTAVQVVSLRAAANAGIKVPEETVNKAMAYIKRCQNNADGGFSYQTTQHGSGPARTGAGLLCLALTNQKGSSEWDKGLKYLVDHPLQSYDWMYKQHEFYAYYYCTQAFYQAGGQPWKTWFTYMRDRLVESQQPEGYWSEYSGAGREYATAMSVLVLQVPAGLLPIYQK